MRFKNVVSVANGGLALKYTDVWLLYFSSEDESRKSKKEKKWVIPYVNGSFDHRSFRSCDYTETKIFHLTINVSSFCNTKILN